jgi:hypothetical protein
MAIECRFRFLPESRGGRNTRSKFRVGYADHVPQHRLSLKPTADPRLDLSPRVRDLFRLRKGKE